MQAAWFAAFGPARQVLVVGEQPQPKPARGEVLVRLMTSGVNPSDVKKRAGSFPNLLDGGLVIPNSDGAGVIEAVGEGVAIVAFAVPVVASAVPDGVPLGVGSALPSSRSEPFRSCRPGRSRPTAPAATRRRRAPRTTPESMRSR